MISDIDLYHTIARVRTAGLATCDVREMPGRTTTSIGRSIAGDADLNEATGIADFARRDVSFDFPTWSGGDFNYDAITNIADFALLAGNLNQSAIAGLPSILLANRGGAMPEPRRWRVAVAFVFIA